MANLVHEKFGAGFMVNKWDSRLSLGFDLNARPGRNIRDGSVGKL